VGRRQGPRQRLRQLHDHGLAGGAQGFTGLKLRASFPEFRQDIRVVEMVRKAVGDDFKILVDGNKAWGGNLHMWDFRRAADTARAYQDMGVYWLEEPLPQYAVEQIAELNRKIDMPLAGGENTSLFNDFLQLIDARAYDILNCEIQFTGPHMARRVQAIAAPRAISVAPHFGDGLLATICQHHLVASWDNAPIAELIHEPPVADFAAIWSIFEKPPVLEKDGTIRMPAEPGLGVSIKPDLLSAV
jgi:D-galactarolactone cycloisomerase